MCQITGLSYLCIKKRKTAKRNKCDKTYVTVLLQFNFEKERQSVYSSCAGLIKQWKNRGIKK